MKHPHAGIRAVGRRPWSVSVLGFSECKSRAEATFMIILVVVLVGFVFQQHDDCVLVIVSLKLAGVAKPGFLSRSFLRYIYVR